MLKYFFFYPAVFIAYIGILFILNEANNFYRIGESQKIVKFIFIYGLSLIILFIYRMNVKDKEFQKGISENIIYSLFLTTVSQATLFTVYFLGQIFPKFKLFFEGWEVVIAILVIISTIDNIKKKFLK